jgi:hypothetical protein
MTIKKSFCACCFLISMYLHFFSSLYITHRNNKEMLIIKKESFLLFYFNFSFQNFIKVKKVYNTLTCTRAHTSAYLCIYYIIIINVYFYLKNEEISRSLSFFLLLRSEPSFVRDFLVHRTFHIDKCISLLLISW